MDFVNLPLWPYIPLPLGEQPFHSLQVAQPDTFVVSAAVSEVMDQVEWGIDEVDWEIGVRDEVMTCEGIADVVEPVGPVAAVFEQQLAVQ
jgi:hypothetical protein